jgi:DNA-binding response OmpR family regulator
VALTLEKVMEAQICPHCGYRLRDSESVLFDNIEVRFGGAILYGETEIELPIVLHGIMEALARAGGRALTLSAIAGFIDRDIDDRTVRKYIERIRVAFRAVDPTFYQIESLKGFGAYRLRRRSVRKPAGWRESRDNSTHPACALT